MGIQCCGCKRANVAHKESNAGRPTYSFLSLLGNTNDTGSDGKHRNRSSSPPHHTREVVINEDYEWEMFEVGGRTSPVNYNGFFDYDGVLSVASEPTSIASDEKSNFSSSQLTDHSSRVGLPRTREARVASGISAFRSGNHSDPELFANDDYDMNLESDILLLHRHYQHSGKQSESEGDDFSITEDNMLDTVQNTYDFATVSSMREALDNEAPPANAACDFSGMELVIARTEDGKYIKYYKDKEGNYYYYADATGAPATGEESGRSTPRSLLPPLDSDQVVSAFSSGHRLDRHRGKDNKAVVVKPKVDESLTVGEPKRGSGPLHRSAGQQPSTEATNAESWYDEFLNFPELSPMSAKVQFFSGGMPEKTTKKEEEAVTPAKATRLKTVGEVAASGRTTRSSGLSGIPMIKGDDKTPAAAPSSPTRRPTKVPPTPSETLERRKGAKKDANAGGSSSAAAPASLEKPSKDAAKRNSSSASKPHSKSAAHSPNETTATTTTTTTSTDDGSLSSSSLSSFREADTTDDPFYLTPFKSRALGDHLEFSKRLITEKIAPIKSKALLYKALQKSKTELSKYESAKQLDPDFAYEPNTPEVVKITHCVYVECFLYLKKYEEVLFKYMEKSMEECISHFKGMTLGRKRKQFICNVVDAMEAELKENKEKAIQAKDSDKIKMHHNMEKQIVTLNRFNDATIENGIQRASALLTWYMEMVLQTHHVIAVIKSLQEFYQKFIKEVMESPEKPEEDDTVLQCASLTRSIKTLEVQHFNNDHVKPLVSQLLDKNTVVSEIDGIEALNLHTLLTTDADQTYPPSKLTFKQLYGKVAFELLKSIQEAGGVRAPVGADGDPPGIKELLDDYFAKVVAREFMEAPLINTPEVQYVNRKLKTQKEKEALKEAGREQPVTATSPPPPRKPARGGTLPTHLYRAPEVMPYPDFTQPKWTKSYRRRRRRELPTAQEQFGYVDTDSLPGGEPRNMLNEAPFVDSPDWESLPIPGSKHKEEKKKKKRFKLF